MIDSWVNSFYNYANNMGFPDPVHAAMIHMPMGLIVGAFVFAWAAQLLRRDQLAFTAHHCIVLAFLFLLPTILFGFADWRHFYAGAWITPIILKMILAAILLVLTLAGAVIGFKGSERSKTSLVVYTLSFLVVVLLGWYGARLVYGGKTQEVPKSFAAGGKIFAARCAACHPDGGNTIVPGKPLRNSPDLKDFKTFMVQLRQPEAPMPAFPESQLSESEAKELYDYITQVLNRTQSSEVKKR